MLINGLVILICLFASKYFYGNYYHLFGERKLGTYASVAALAASGWVSLHIHKRVAPARIARFWFAFAILMFFAAADDMFRLHEEADRGIHRLLGWNPNNRITDHLDDVFVLCYTVPALYLGWKYRRELLQARLTAQVLALAMVVFVVHLTLDVVTVMLPLEESLKQTAGCLIFLAFLAAYLQPTLPPSWEVME